MFNRLRSYRFRLTREELQDIRRYIDRVQSPPDSEPTALSDGRWTRDFARRHNYLTNIPYALAAFLVDGCNGYSMYHWYDLPADMGPSFRHILSMMIDQYGLGKSCRYAGISRRAYYRLFDPAYTPSKDLIIRIGLANQLTLGQANLLLNRAGYTLETTCERDLILDYCFQQYMFDIDIVNDALRRLGQRPLARK